MSWSLIFHERKRYKKQMDTACNFDWTEKYRKILIIRSKIKELIYINLKNEY